MRTAQSNLVERAIRPHWQRQQCVAIHRFSYAAAQLRQLARSRKLSSMERFYHKDVLACVNSHRIHRFHKLLPFNSVR